MDHKQFSGGVQLTCAAMLIGLSCAPITVFADSATDDTQVTLTVTEAAAGGTTGGGGTSGGSTGGSGGGGGGLREESIERKIETIQEPDDISLEEGLEEMGEPEEPGEPGEPEKSEDLKESEEPRGVETPGAPEAPLHDAAAAGSVTPATRPMRDGEAPLTDIEIHGAIETQEKCDNPLSCIFAGVTSQTEEIAAAAIRPLLAASPLKLTILIVLFTLMTATLRMLYGVMGRLNRNEAIMEELAAVPVHFSGWYILNVVILLLLAYVAVILFEFSRAADTVVQFVVGNVSLNCTATVSLGSLEERGDTGAFSTSRAATCTVETTNSSGYALSWKIQSGSGGTLTGSLINADEDAVSPYTPTAANTPETWSVGVSDAEWGARLSSTSDTVSTATWGIDGSSEKWLNVGTGSFTIATRPDANSGSPDDEIIGFRATIGDSVTQPAGAYKATVTFTATDN